MLRLDWDTYVGDFLPTLLTEWGAGAVASSIGDEIRERANSFAASDATVRATLTAPFLEEVVDYRPLNASLAERAAVCLVVRCSGLEEIHAGGAVDPGGIEGLTTTAAAPLADWLRQQQPPSVRGPQGVFEGLDARWPRAWSALDGVSRIAQGGRWSPPIVEAALPPMPSDQEVLNARTDDDGRVISSANAVEFDQAAMSLLGAAGPDFRAVVPNLSRFSRDLDKLMRIIEILLSRGSAILTTNLLLRPNDVHCRRKMIAPDTYNLQSVLASDAGLSGVHRKIFNDVRNRGLETSFGAAEC